MANYLAMDGAALHAELQQVQEQFDAIKKRGLKLDMSRGKPSPEQLDLSMDLLKINDCIGESGVDARNYGQLEGMPEARRFFAEMLGVAPSEVIVGGNSSLNLMYNLVEMGWRKGFADSEEPWCKTEHPKFLCPAPGYDRHFRVTEDFGFELITVPMLPTGPDMEMVEKLVQDSSVKGIWCVPKYSNPDGYTYSDDTVRRLAAMKPGAADFKIFWDNAYSVHDINDTPDTLLNLMDACKQQGTENRVLEFCSLSKVTFPGASVSAMAASETNIADILKKLMPALICFDKFNQLRHVRYLKNLDGVKAHMQLHRALVSPKFEVVQNALENELGACGDIAHWTKPNGGYFISLFVMKGCAKDVVAKCKEAGVVLTGAGAAYPYGVDPDDSNIRIAPTFPSLDDMKAAAEVLCICVRLSTLIKLVEG